MKKTFKTFKAVKSEFKIVTGWREPWHFSQRGIRECYTECGCRVWKDEVNGVYVVEDGNV